MKLDPLTYTKTNLKWINNLNIRGNPIKLLEENIKVCLHDLGFGNRFLDMEPKVWATKEKKQVSRTSSKLKTCALKDITKEVKWQPIGWEKIFSNHKSGKGLVPRLYLKTLIIQP